jgi:hypothetical protein
LLSVSLSTGSLKKLLVGGKSGVELPDFLSFSYEIANSFIVNLDSETTTT